MKSRVLINFVFQIKIMKKTASQVDSLNKRKFYEHNICLKPEQYRGWNFHKTIHPTFNELSHPTSNQPLRSTLQTSSRLTFHLPPSLSIMRYFEDATETSASFCLFLLIVELHQFPKNKRQNVVWMHNILTIC